MSHMAEGNTIAYFRLNQQGAFSAIACILYEGKLVEPKGRNMFSGNLYDIMPADAVPDGVKLQFAFGTADTSGRTSRGKFPTPVARKKCLPDQNDRLVSQDANLLASFGSSSARPSFRLLNDQGQCEAGAV